MPVEVGKLTRKQVEAFEEHLFAEGRSATTVSARHRSLQQFFRWLEGRRDPALTDRQDAPAEGRREAR
jgi:hypothetical protein